MDAEPTNRDIMSYLAEIREDMTFTKEEILSTLRSEMSEVKTELNHSIKQVRVQLNARIDALSQDMSHLKKPF